MAIYEYGCKKCGEKFELMRRIAKRDDVAACPKCGARTTKRIEIQRVAVITGVAPDIMAGDGDPEDFGFGGDDDFGGMDMDDF